MLVVKAARVLFPTAAGRVVKMILPFRAKGCRIVIRRLEQGGRMRRPRTDPESSPGLREVQRAFLQ